MPDANANIYFVVDNKNHHKKKNFKIFQLLLKRSLNISQAKVGATQQM